MSLDCQKYQAARAWSQHARVVKNWPATGESEEFAGLIAAGMHRFMNIIIVASQSIVGLIGVTFADQRETNTQHYSSVTKPKEGHLRKRIFTWRSHITQTRGKIP